MSTVKLKTSSILGGDNQRLEGSWGDWHFIRLSSQHNLKLKRLPQASCDQSKYSSFIHHVFIKHILKIIANAA
jgi:hypothetical protein